MSKRAVQNRTEQYKDPRRLAYIDFDGEKLNPGKNYRTLKAQSKARAKARLAECGHKDVMITSRCRCCSLVIVVLRSAMIK